MSKMKMITGFVAGVIAALMIAREAEACVRPHDYVPQQPVLPKITGDSPHAVIARPIKITWFEKYGVRYWRAQYERVVYGEIHLPNPNFVVEWSCDPRDSTRDDVCGGMVTSVLPGFDGNGRVDSPYVQLELRWQNESTFDGVRLYYASREGSFRVDAPAQPVYRYGAQGEYGVRAETTTRSSKSRSS